MTEEQQRVVDGHIVAGRNIDAILHYRRASGASLIDAKEYVESRARAFAADGTIPVARRGARTGSLLAVLLVATIVGLAAALVVPRLFHVQ